MIGVDIGGTNLLVGRIKDGRVVEMTHTEVAAGREAESAVEQVCEQILAIGGQHVEQIGIAVAGSVDCTSGVVLRAENLNWDNVPLAAMVSKQLGCKVLVENDVTAAAWGEFSHGAGRGRTSLFAVWVGTGIGGGLVLDRKLWRGPLGTAGEFGMSISSPELSSTPLRQLESIASRSGIQHVLANPNLTTNEISQGFAKKDRNIVNAVNESARRIGTGIANVITLLSLDCVVLGGGLVESLGVPYVELIRNQFESDVFPEHCKQCDIVSTELGPHAGLLGVASLASK